MNSHSPLIRRLPGAPPGGVVARLRGRGETANVLRAAGLIGLLTIGVKVAGMGRDVVLASEFGTGDAVEAFLAAWAIPQFLAGITGSAFAGVAIPLQARAQARGGEAESGRFLSELLLISVAAMAVLTALMVPARGLLLPLATSSFSPEKLALTERLWLIMLPGLFLYALILLWQAVLNTRRRFGLAALSPVVVPAATIGALLLFPGAGIEAPAVGFVVGMALQGGLLLEGMRRAGMVVWPRWHGGLAETRTAVGEFAPYLANGTLFGGLGVVDQAMAATLGSGSLATLSYGNKLVLPILGISSSALATAVYPQFARMVAEEQWRELRDAARRYTTLILAATVPATVAVVVLSPWIVRLVFERGAFNASDSDAVASVQAMYALIIPMYTVAHLLSRVINAMSATKYMAIGSAFIFAFNVGADYLFKGWLGIEGIALATVFNFGLSLALNVWLLRRLLAAQIAAQGQAQGEAKSAAAGRRAGAA